MTISELRPGDVVTITSNEGYWMFTGEHPFGGIESRYMMVRVDVWPFIVENFNEDTMVHTRYEKTYAWTDHLHAFKSDRAPVVAMIFNTLQDDNEEKQEVDHDA